MLREHLKCSYEVIVEFLDPLPEYVRRSIRMESDNMLLSDDFTAKNGPSMH